MQSTFSVRPNLKRDPDLTVEELQKRELHRTRNRESNRKRRERERLQRLRLKQEQPVSFVLENPPPPPSPPPAPIGVYAQRPHGSVRKEILPDQGVAIDPRSPYAVWAGGHLTRLPFISDPDNPELNALRTLGPHLERLVADAQDARHSACVDYYLYGEDVVELGRMIKESMAKGNMAIVEGCPDVHRIELSTGDLFKYLHIKPDETFDTHDMLLRETDFEHPHVRTTLDGFIASMKDPNVIQAILDSTSGALLPPPWLCHVDEGYIATDKLQDLFNGLPVDIKSSRLWVIKHHPLFHTYLHHDASGTGTWTGIRSGYKFWVKVVGKQEFQCTSLKGLYKSYAHYFLTEQDSGEWGFLYPPNCERHCVFGKPGDIIFQPPNAWHEVYTPSASVTIGGHFYSYDTLHLTDVGRRFDIVRPGMTNQHHSSSQLTLSAMMVYMIRRGPQAYRRKPLTSLCRMILRADLYLCKREAEDRDLAQAITAYIRRRVPKHARNAKGTVRVLALQPIAKRAILIADTLVDQLGLDYDNEDHLFDTLPWTDVGETVMLTQEHIESMEEASTAF